jgi:hypothetical protein
MKASEKTPLGISMHGEGGWHELVLFTGGVNYNDGIRSETRSTEIGTDTLRSAWGNPAQSFAVCLG